VRRTLLILAISASLAVSGCSALPGAGGGGGLPNVKGGLCERYVAAGAQAKDDATRLSTLDQAIKSCRTLDQWVAAVETYGGNAVTPDASTYLAARCVEPTSGVGRYMLCGLYAQSLITPPPAPTHKPKHKPKKTAKPSPLPDLVVSSPYPPVASMAPVPPAIGAAPSNSVEPGGSSPAH